MSGWDADVEIMMKGKRPSQESQGTKGEAEGS
jgi:hypothetical protein